MGDLSKEPSQLLYWTKMWKPQPLFNKGHSRDAFTQVQLLLVFFQNWKRNTYSSYFLWKCLTVSKIFYLLKQPKPIPEKLIPNRKDDPMFHSCLGEWKAILGLKTCELHYHINHFLCSNKNVKRRPNIQNQKTHIWRKVPRVVHFVQFFFYQFNK